MDTAEPPKFQPIACERLDKENAAWVRQYVEKWQARLAAQADDPEIAAYARREIAAYQDLLNRFAIVILAGFVLTLALARPAGALVQYGQHPVSWPALLADRLRLASEDLGEARVIGRPTGILERIHAADRELKRASYDTVDPAEQRRIAGYRAQIHDLGRELDKRHQALGPILLRLDQAVRSMADQVEARVALRTTNLAPLTRPPLGKTP